MPPTSSEGQPSKKFKAGEGGVGDPMHEDPKSTHEGDGNATAVTADTTTTGSSTSKTAAGEASRDAATGRRKDGFFTSQERHDHNAARFKEREEQGLTEWVPSTEDSDDAFYADQQADREAQFPDAYAVYTTAAAASLAKMTAEMASIDETYDAAVNVVYQIRDNVVAGSVTRETKNNDLITKELAELAKHRDTLKQQLDSWSLPISLGLQDQANKDEERRNEVLAQHDKDTIEDRRVFAATAVAQVQNLATCAQELLNAEVKEADALLNTTATAAADLLQTQTSKASESRELDTKAADVIVTQEATTARRLLRKQTSDEAELVAKAAADAQKRVEKNLADAKQLHEEQTAVHVKLHKSKRHEARKIRTSYETAARVATSTQL